MRRSDKICKPLMVLGVKVPGTTIAKVIDRMANVPAYFRSQDLLPVTLGVLDLARSEELLNRLFQRWRLLGLMEFKNGKWKLTNGAWAVMQMAARRQ